MHPVLILSYNGLPMLKKCVESVLAQDVPDVYLRILDNGSTDGTIQWFSEFWKSGRKNWSWYGFDSNKGVSYGWNHGLKEFFDPSATEDGFPADQCLVLNQDLILGPSAYRELLEFNVPFVTGFPVQTEFEISPLAAKPQIGLSPYPCFSAFLIRRSCWEKVGPFNEEFFAWAGDCDYHVRAHRLGVGMFKSGVPFYHEAGSTARNAPPEEKAWFAERANKDREVFRSLYGCIPGEEPAYTKLFQNLE